jgi:HDOD domain
MSLTLSEIQIKTLAILEARIDQVALLPSVFSKLSKLEVDSVDATEKIESLIRSDPPLALRVMRLANADGVATRNVATIGEALIQVGTKRLADMIRALSTVELFVPSTQAQPSRRAALRLGFSFEGIFRQHMVIKDRNRDTAWFAMLDHDWPARKQAFERWLDPGNFMAEGKQRCKLAANPQLSAPENRLGSLRD